MPQPLARYDQLPLRFEPNRGQTDPRVRFLARGTDDTLFLTASEAVLTLVRPRACGDNPADDAAAEQVAPVTTLVRRARPDALARSRIAGLCPAAATAGGATLRWRFLNANPHPRIVAQERLPGVSSYLIGRDPRHWRRAIPGYARVAYRGLYPGVDLVYYGQQGGQIEYDLELAPGADLRRVRLAVQGAASPPRLDGAGNLLLPLAGGTLVQQRPIVYQEVAGVRRAVAARYVLGHGGTLGFAVGAHDHRRPLVLDPVLVYSTYLGGSGGGTDGRSIAIDGAGHVYITGFTSSHDFPTNRPGALGGAQDAFVAEFDPSKSGTASLLYSTYLGGSGTDDGSGIAVDPTCTSGCHAYVTGTTSSPDFPTTTNAYSRTLAGAADTFITELSTDGGALLYSTLLGGSAGTIPGSGARTGSTGIAVDAAGHAYVTGATLSSDFPTTTNAYSSTVTGVLAAYVAELDPSATGTASLLYSTVFGTNDTYGIAVQPGCASDCRAAVAGTAFADLPTTPNAYLANPGCATAFMSEFNPAADGPASLDYSSCLGGDDANGVAMDTGGRVYVTGDASDPSFPTTTNAYSSTLTGQQDAYVSELDTSRSGTASLLYSTFFGGGVSIRAGGKSYNAVTTGYGVAVDGAGHIYLTGTTDTTDFPTTPNAYVRAPQVRIDNMFVSELDPAAGAQGLLYSTYLSPYGSYDTDVAYGIAVDPRCAGGCRSYITGQAASADFPTTPTAYARTLPSANGAAFVSEIDTGMSGAASLAYSTFLGGGGGANSATSIAVDGAGHAYIAGQAASADFPTTTVAHARTLASPYGNAFVAEISADGRSLLYSTYLGGSGNGSFGGDSAGSIATDGAGHAYVTGRTFSPDFPTTANAYARTQAGPNGNAFVAELSADGSSLLYSTYLGGSGTYNQTSVIIGQTGTGICLSGVADCGDAGAGIAVDPGCTATCHVYVTGSTYSADFPTTTTAYSRTLVSSSVEAFVAELDPSLSGAASLRYSTYLGGSGGYPYTFEGDSGSAIAAGGAGRVYVTGVTYSTNFPTTTTAYTSTLRGIDGNAFVSEIDPSLSGTAGLLYSTFLGGSGVSGPATWTFGDSGAGIALTPGCASACHVYVAGYTYSTDFPTTPTAYSNTLSGSEDAFVSEIDPSKTGTASLRYSTYLGGSGTNAAGGIAVDPAGRAFVTGSTFSTDFPTTADACSRTLAGREEGFVAEIDPSGSGSASLRSSTYLGGGPAAGVTYGGGIAVDGSDHVYVTGYTTSPSLPTSTGAFSSTLTDVDGTAFVSAFDFGSAASGPPPPGPCTSGAQVQPIAVRAGWNLISLPLQPTGTLHASDLLAGLLRANPASRLVALFALTGDAWSEPCLLLAGQATCGNNFPLAVGVGYLLYSDVPNSFAEQGTVPSAGPTWALGQGWNLVGLSAASPGGLTAATVLQGVLASGGGGVLAALFSLAGNA